LLAPPPSSLTPAASQRTLHVAHEYGIPAVLGARDATARLRNGQRVAVDGTTGVVDLRS